MSHVTHFETMQARREIEATEREREREREASMDERQSPLIQLQVCCSVRQCVAVYV